VTLRVEQEATPQEGDRWNWSVWLEGPPHELDDVESVTYYLHSTFPDPIRTVTDRNTKFKLEATGWGMFTINLEIRRKHGRPLQRSHDLVLEYPKESEARVEKRRKGRKARVFLVSSVADRVVVSSLREALEREGFELATEGDLAPGLPWDVSMPQALRSSDAVIAIVSDLTSPYVESAINLARSLNVPILPVRVGLGSDMPEALRDIQPVRVKESPEIPRFAEQIISGLHNVIPT
jgi:hypothetical protein